MKFVLIAALVTFAYAANASEAHCPELDQATQCRIDTSTNLHNLITGVVTALPSDHGQCKDEASATS